MELVKNRALKIEKEKNENENPTQLPNQIRM